MENYAKNVKLVDKLLDNPYEKPIILDVRTKQEFMQSHICNSINIRTPTPPLSLKQRINLYQNLGVLLENIPRTRPIIVYCKKGIRANEAKKILNSMGFINVISIGGVLTEPLKSLFDGEIEYKNLDVCI